MKISDFKLFNLHSCFFCFRCLSNFFFCEKHRKSDSKYFKLEAWKDMKEPNRKRSNESKRKKQSQTGDFSKPDFIDESLSVSTIQPGPSVWGWLEAAELNLANAKNPHHIRPYSSLKSWQLPHATWNRKSNLFHAVPEADGGSPTQIIDLSHAMNAVNERCVTTRSS